MGRPGITFDQVAGAAHALEAEGAAATLQAVRARLGDTGSMSTIQRHLIAWRANQPKEAAAPVELPSDVVRTMNAWVIQASTAARAQAESDMLRAQSELDLLVKDGSQLEAERDRLIDEAVVLTTQRDKAEALAKERSDELERMARDLEREREVANAAQIKTAESQLKLEAQAQQLGDLKTEVGRLNDALDAERQARAKAETDAAVLRVELASANKQVDGERARADGLQAKLDESAKEKESLRGAYESRMQDIERVGKEAIAAERVATDKARTEAHAAALQVVDLRARLEMAEEKLADLEGATQTPDK